MSEPLAIEVDVQHFRPASAIDSCAVCNLLSSPRLLAAAAARNVWFVVAEYVRYETLVRERTDPTEADLEIQEEFRKRLGQGQGFWSEGLSLGDLQAVANLPEIRRLGRGEIAAMALARKLRVGYTTDDQKARKAEQLAIDAVQTTPHLLG
jgi:hypothetical protein